MIKEFDEYILPACWASGLINGDWSGFTAQSMAESEAIDEFLKDKGSCVSCSEDEWFQWGHDFNKKEGATVMKFYFDKN